MQNKKNGRFIVSGFVLIIILLFTLVLFNVSEMFPQIIAALCVVLFVPLVVAYFVQYDEEENTRGLTASSINEARRHFKEGEPNDERGERVSVHMKKVNGDDTTVQFSREDMKKMKAHTGDLVYLADKRKWLGGLKSIHSVIGEPHEETGLVYLTEEQMENGLFDSERMLDVEKEM
jgi:SSS family solute:Na+ symporter